MPEVAPCEIEPANRRPTGDKESLLSVDLGYGRGSCDNNSIDDHDEHGQKHVLMSPTASSGVSSPGRGGDDDEMFIFPLTWADIGATRAHLSNVSPPLSPKSDSGLLASRLGRRTAYRTFSQPIVNKWRRVVRRVMSLEDPWIKFNISDYPTERAKRYRYSAVSQKWVEDYVEVKMQTESFSRGAMRECFRMKKKATEGLKNEEWDSALNYVAKHYISPVERDTYFEDVRLQMDAKLWGEEYNRHNPPKKIDMLQMSVLEFADREGSPLYHLEHFIEGNYIKYNSNSGYVNELYRQTPQAFSHFTFERSGHQLIVVDVQGVGDLYTDPQIHTTDGKGYGDGNLGTKGMALYFHSHVCNEICSSMGLSSFDLSPAERAQAKKLTSLMQQRKMTTVCRTRIISCTSSGGHDASSVMDYIRSRSSMSACSDHSDEGYSLDSIRSSNNHVGNHHHHGSHDDVNVADHVTHDQLIHMSEPRPRSGAVTPPQKSGLGEIRTRTRGVKFAVGGAGGQDVGTENAGDVTLLADDSFNGNSEDAKETSMNATILPDDPLMVGSDPCSLADSAMSSLAESANEQHLRSQMEEMGGLVKHGGGLRKSRSRQLADIGYMNDVDDHNYNQKDTKASVGGNMIHTSAEVVMNGGDNNVKPLGVNGNVPAGARISFVDAGGHSQPVMIMPSPRRQRFSSDLDGSFTCSKEEEKEAFWNEMRMRSRPSCVFLDLEDVKALQSSQQDSGAQMDVLGQIHLDMARYHEIGRFLSREPDPAESYPERFSTEDEEDSHKVETTTEGPVAEFDRHSAWFHLEAAVSCGNLEAILAIAAIYLGREHTLLAEMDMKDEEDALEHGVDMMEKAAELGDRDAMLFMAQAYDTGNMLGCERSRDWAQSAHWYEQALEQLAECASDESGDVDASLDNPKYMVLARLAEMYREGGWELVKNPAHAGDLYNEAAEAAMEAMKGKLANKYYMLAEEAYGEVEEEEEIESAGQTEGLAVEE